MIQEAEASTGLREDLLGRLLTVRDEDGTAIKREQLCDELITFLIAGRIPCNLPGKLIVGTNFRLLRL